MKPAPMCVLGQPQAEALQWVAMDMWPAFIKLMTKHLPDAHERIVFDKFHIAQYLGNAVDLVRRAGHRELMRDGDDRLKDTCYRWLRNPHNKSSQQWRGFESLRNSHLKVARARAGAPCTRWPLDADSLGASPLPVRSCAGMVIRGTGPLTGRLQVFS